MKTVYEVFPVDILAPEERNRKLGDWMTLPKI